jgi:hypothetical protein
MTHQIPTMAEAAAFVLSIIKHYSSLRVCDRQYPCLIGARFASAGNFRPKFGDITYYGALVLRWKTPLQLGIDHMVREPNSLLEVDRQPATGR